MGIYAGAMVRLLLVVIYGFYFGFYVLCKPTTNKEYIQNFENITFTFDCSDKAVGFYADLEHNCQIFHMCQGDGKRIPHVCANETSFNQEYRICDWIYNFDCSEAEKWYYLNELTYAQDTDE